MSFDQLGNWTLALNGTQYTHISASSRHGRVLHRRIPTQATGGCTEV